MSQTPPDRTTPAARAIAERFPAPQGEVGELFALACAETATLDELTRALTKRPVLAVRFVRLASCSYWGPGGTITGIRSAIEQVGASATPWAALVLGVASALREACPAGDPAHAAWARRAWTRAVAALTFTRRSRAPHAPEAFACAFLHGIGEQALSLARPDVWAELARAHAGGVPLAAQREAFECDRSEVEAALLEAWKVPALVSEVLARAGGAEIGSDEESGVLAERVSLAEAIVRLFEEDDKGRALTRIEERAASAFHLAPEAVYEALFRLDGFVRESLDLFESAPGQPMPVRQEDESTGRLVTRRNRGRTLPAELEHRRMIPSDPELLDPECGVPGREAFDRFLDREIQARLSAAVQRPMCVLVLSIEGFPRKHREHGADAARAWLRETSRKLASRVRRGDLFARLGGSYFGVCMSEADPHAMELLAERLHATLASSEPAETPAMSLGGACLAKAQHPDDGRALLRTGVRLLKQALEEHASTRLLHAPIAPRRVA